MLVHCPGPAPSVHTRAARAARLAPRAPRVRRHEARRPRVGVSAKLSPHVRVGPAGALESVEMKVSEALATRVSIRDFLPTPVPGETIRRVLAAASRAPSGGNLQPWHIDVVAGERLDELRGIVRERIAAGVQEKLDYTVYPSPLVSP